MAKLAQPSSPNSPPMQRKVASTVCCAAKMLEFCRELAAQKFRHGGGGPSADLAGIFLLPVSGRSVIGLAAALARFSRRIRDQVFQTTWHAAAGLYRYLIVSGLLEGQQRSLMVSIRNFH